MVRTSKIFFIFAIFASLLLPACGRKTLPIPPHAVIPKAIRDLHYFQDESRVVLSWTYPEKTTSATDIQNIETFQVMRAVVPLADYCQTCPVNYSSLVEIGFDEAVKDLKARRAQFTETILRPGHQYIYKVRTKSGWRILSDDSNEVSFAWESPAAAPASLSLTEGDQTVSLSWSAVDTFVDGSKADDHLLYQVLRSVDGGDFLPVGSLTPELEFRDAGLTNGWKYTYKVRAVKQSENSKVYGISSSIVSGTPKDLTPPFPPRDLVVVKVTDGIKLMWERGTATDIAGYRIYRREGSGQDRKLIGETGPNILYHVDKDIPKAKVSLLYSITAYDNARSPNESLFSKEVTYEPF